MARARAPNVLYEAQIARASLAAYVYILRCRDRSYYVGITRASLEHRISQHQAGTYDGYTALRRPVELVFHQEFDRIEDAIAAERQLKGWSRAKKEALMNGDYALLRSLSKRRGGNPAHLILRCAPEARHEGRTAAGARASGRTSVRASRRRCAAHLSMRGHS
jgi:putative endonuclease